MFYFSWEGQLKVWICVYFQTSEDIILATRATNILC